MNAFRYLVYRYHEIIENLIYFRPPYYLFKCSAELQTANRQMQKFNFIIFRVVGSTDRIVTFLEANKVSFSSGLLCAARAL